MRRRVPGRDLEHAAAAYPWQDRSREVSSLDKVVASAAEAVADVPAFEKRMSRSPERIAAAEDPLVSAVTREDGREDLLPRLRRHR